MRTEPDATDLRILAALRRDARTPASKIARELRLPRSTIAERITRLEEDGIVLGYTAKVDHARVDEGATAFVFVRIKPDATVRDQNISLSRQLARVPGVEEVHMISGEWDIIAKVRSADLKRFFDEQMEAIRRIAGVERTLTMTCFTTVKEPV